MVLWLLLSASLSSSPVPEHRLDEDRAEQLSRIALRCVQRVYPSQLARFLRQRHLRGSPQEVAPVFYGCYDWHSAVHNHWMLVRLLRLFPEHAHAEAVRRHLEDHLTAEAVAQEVHHLRLRPAGFERPYGLAWLLRFCAELRAWDHEPARRWLARLEPLENLGRERLMAWLRATEQPLRTGQHRQTAFSMSLLFDWAYASGDTEVLTLVKVKARRLFPAGHCPLAAEPAPDDFLSPCLAEADLKRRLLAPEPFAAWLTVALPEVPAEGRGDWLEPARVRDPADRKQIHAAGLNLSRAWMLERIADALPASDRRRAPLLASAEAHRHVGLAWVGTHLYEGAHWLASFATYLLSRDPTVPVERVRPSRRRRAAPASGRAPPP